MASIKIIKDKLIIINKNILSIKKTHKYKLYYFGYKKKITSTSLRDILKNPSHKLSGVLEYNGKIYLYRDKYSPAPLYYSRTSSGNLIVADRFSEFDSSIISEGLSKNEYLKRIRGIEKDLEKTIFPKIKRLPPGNILCINEMRMKSVKKYSHKKMEFSKILRSIIDEVIIEKDGLCGLFLSEGMDSGAILNILKKNRKKYKSLSIIFDKRAQKIIKQRDNDVIEFFPGELKNYIQGKVFDSIDYDFNPNAEIFVPLLKKSGQLNIKRVLMGTGGDEIHGSDFPYDYFWDNIIRGKIRNIRRPNPGLIIKLLKNLPKGVFKGSFLKYRIQDVLSSYFFIFNLEKIWMFFTDHGVEPFFPFYDVRLISIIMRSDINDIVSFNRKTGFLVKNFNNGILDTKSNKRNFLDIILASIDIKKEIYYEWLDDISYEKYKKCLDNLS